jgi:hypothetical protein
MMRCLMNSLSVFLKRCIRLGTTPSNQNFHFFSSSGVVPRSRMRFLSASIFSNAMAGLTPNISENSRRRRL